MTSTGSGGTHPELDPAVGGPIGGRLLRCHQGHALTEAACDEPLGGNPGSHQIVEHRIGPFLAELPD